ncbi:prohormone-1-like [Pollicipes pollicipes]|uniref:prohormone-1-like n=1 Tax=Pollicipes pollicipes TaxID=41117 RepID=UPI001884E555|nr:prohormone-1-like [Pollicipes pollicipes]XP_037090390.1 prohormone-1-like [Pollicipes pollicipes]
MTPARLIVLLAVCLSAVLSTAAAKALEKGITFPQFEGTGDRQLDVMEDDGTAETALLNYLYARQMLRRLRKNLDVSELQQKRSYWKQCSFNAVSCFG